MDILIRNKYFRRECLRITWTELKALLYGKIWYYDYINIIKHHLDIICKKGYVFLLPKFSSLYSFPMLLLGIEYKNLSIVQYAYPLCSKDTIHGEGTIVINKCALYKNISVTQYLLENGVQIDADLELFIAATHGCLYLVKHAISIGGNIYAKNNFALRWSLSNNHPHVSQHLLQYYTDSNIPISPVLSNSIRYKNWDILHYTMEHYAHLLTHTDCKIFFILCLNYANIEMADFLYNKCNMNIDIDDTDIKSAFCNMSNKGNIKVAQYLVEKHGFIVDKKVLHSTVYYDNIELLQYFVEKVGISVNTDLGPIGGGTLLQISVNNYNTKIVLYLLDKGARGNVPLWFFQRGGDVSNPSTLMKFIEVSKYGNQVADIYNLLP